MAEYLFPQFLSDDQEYSAAAAFWNELMLEVVNSHAEGDLWVSWRPRSYANGLPFDRDGNPIFNARSERLPRALQVIQWPDDAENSGISAWISPLEIDGRLVWELTINLTLSTESLPSPSN